MADNRLKAVATAQAYDQGNIASLDDAMTRRLVASTVLTESFGGDLGPINRLGYVGRYQAGAAWLVDAGYIPLDRFRAARDSMSGAQWERGGGQLRFMQDARNWNNGLSLDQYLASDDLQDRAFRINSNRSYQQAVRNGLLDENSSPETVAGFLKARHLSGYEGARSVIQGGRVIRDENGTSNYDYFHDITRNRDGLNALMGNRSFDEIMRVMLPPISGVGPHITSPYGQRTLNGRLDNHGGVDFNYVGGQSGPNLQHPQVRSPVSGEVIFSGGQYGTVKIRDAQGNTHEILHLHSRVVQLTDPPTRVAAGEPIGTMGGRGPSEASQFAQHVHYQIRDADGRTVDPEAFWDARSVDGPLRIDSRGPEVGALQRSLNQLGYSGRNGQPLETRSSVFGAETSFAVQAFQRAHGLDVDGVVGNDTRVALASAAQRPLVSEATHPQQRLYAAIVRQLPSDVRPEAAANITLQALENGINAPDQIRGIVVRGRDVIIAKQGVDPGNKIQVDLDAPTGTMQQMSDHMRLQPRPSEQVPAPQQILGDVQSNLPEALRPRQTLPAY